MPGFRIRRGACHPLFVFEVGFAIDLERAADRLPAGVERPVLRHRERASTPFEYRPAPLRLAQDLRDAAVPAFPLGPTVEIILYDFGAVSLSYTIPLGHSPDDVPALSVALRGHEPLLADARKRVTELIGSLGPAVQRPRVAGMVEDYFVFEITEVEGVADGASFCADHAEWLSRGLRGGIGAPSPDEVADATQARISYGRGDVTRVDWDSAFILDPDPGDLRAVPEFQSTRVT